jgi:gamma-glutamylcyclotransferase (GGCT)/AIG2-like uncharacterized protein YtfP
MGFMGSSRNSGRHIYFSYGSNLNRSQMGYRCPDAFPTQSFRLVGWKLVFRGVADIMPVAGSAVWGGLWSVSERDLQSLDRYEGVGRGHYKRIEIECGVNDCVFAYVLGGADIHPPEPDYFEVVRQGYGDWNLPLTGLMAARQAAADFSTGLRRQRQPVV